MGNQGKYSQYFDQKGSALPLILVLVTVLLVVGVAALKVSNRSVETSALDTKKTDALYVAESAISVNKDLIDTSINAYITKKETDPTAGFENVSRQNVSINNGTYNFDLILSNAAKNEFLLSVTGKVKDYTNTNVVKKVSLLFTPSSTQQSGNNGNNNNTNPDNNQFLTSVYSQGIYSATEIALGNNANIKGDYSYTDKISGKNVVYNSSKGTVLPIPAPMPSVDETECINSIKASSGVVVNGNKSISGYSDLSNTYITGDLTDSGNSTINISGLVFVGGDIVFNNNITINGTGTLIAKGTITIKNNINVGLSSTKPGISIVSLSSDSQAIDFKNNANLHSVLLAPNGGISFFNNVNMTGSIVAQSITANNNTNVTYKICEYSKMYLPGVNSPTQNTGNDDDDSNDNDTTTGSGILPGYKIIEWNE